MGGHGSLTHTRPPHPVHWPRWDRRRPSGIPEEDVRSALMPYFVQQRDALRRRVHRQEAENRQLAEAVLAGRGRVQELRQRGRARQQAWQVSVPGLVPSPRDRLLLLVRASTPWPWGSPRDRSPGALKRAH